MEFVGVMDTEDELIHHRVYWGWSGEAGWALPESQAINRHLL